MAPLSTEVAPPDNSIAWHLWVGGLATGIPATIAVKQSVGVVCTCLPCLRLLLGLGYGWNAMTNRTAMSRTDRTARQHETRTSMPENEPSEVDLTTTTPNVESSAGSTSDTIFSDTKEMACPEYHEKHAVWQTHDLRGESISGPG